ILDRLGADHGLPQPRPAAVAARRLVARDRAQPRRRAAHRSAHRPRLRGQRRVLPVEQVLRRRQERVGAVTEVAVPARDARPGGRWSTPSLVEDVLHLAAVERAVAHVTAGWVPKVPELDAKLRPPTDSRAPWPAPWRCESTRARCSNATT